MRKILLKLFILFPCTAMGIMEFTFDTTTNNPHICLFARHDSGNKIRVTSNIPSHTVKNAYILLQQNTPHNVKGEIKYKYCYKMLTVDHHNNIHTYRFSWTEDINEICRDSITEIIEKNIITTTLEGEIKASSFNIFIEKKPSNYDSTYMSLFYKCPNLIPKRNIKYMSLKYENYINGESYQKRRRILLINDELLFASNYNNMTPEAVTADN